MKLLGIDYGTKRVGTALSDEAGAMAFPYDTFPNDEKLLETLSSLCKKEGVNAVIIGESRDFKQKENPVMKEARAFGELLGTETKLPVYFEPEFLTSREAARLPGKGETAREKQKPLAKSDKASAALILQSYIDKQMTSDQ